MYFFIKNVLFKTDFTFCPQNVCCQADSDHIYDDVMPANKRDKGGVLNFK